MNWDKIVKFLKGMTWIEWMIFWAIVLLVVSLAHDGLRRLMW